MTSAGGGWRRWAAVLLGLQVAHLSLWLWLDRTAAPPVDAGAHLRNALLAYDAFTPPTLDSFRRAFGLYATYPYPPLAYLATIPFQWLLGPTPEACGLMNVAAYAAALVAVWRLAVRLGGERAGLVAAIIAGGDAVLLLQVGQFYVDAPVAALCLWQLVAIGEADDGRRAGWTLAVGAIAGLGLLTKWTYPLYVGPLLLWFAGRALRAGQRQALLRAVLLAGVLAAPWYVVNLGLLADFLAWNAGLAGNYAGTGLAAWTFYLWDSGARHLTWPLAALCWLGVLALCRRREPTATALLWFIFGAALLLGAVKNKSHRYDPPLVAAMAVAGAVWLDGLRGRRWWLAVAVALSAVNLAAALYGPADGREWRLGPVRLTTYPFVREPWQPATAAFADRAVAALGEPGAAPEPIALLHPRAPQLHPLFVAWELERAERAARPGPWPDHRRLEPVFQAAWDDGPVKLPERVLDEFCLLVVHLLPGDPREALLAARSAWREVLATPLPDGGRLALWRRGGGP